MRLLTILSIFLLTFSSCRKDPWVVAQNEFEDHMKGVSGARTTLSGVFYVIDEEGTGDQPQNNSTITLYYKGMLMSNGSVFTESDAGSPLKGSLSSILVPGLQDGLRNFKAGSKGTIYVPYRMGYGPVGTADVPGYSNLIFEVNLVAVK